MELSDLKNLLAGLESLTALQEKVRNLEQNIHEIKDLKPILTHKDIMDLHGISYSTILRRINSGELVSSKSGATHIIKREDYLTYINNLKNG